MYKSFNKISNLYDLNYIIIDIKTEGRYGPTTFDVALLSDVILHLFHTISSNFVILNSEKLFPLRQI